MLKYQEGAEQELEDIAEIIKEAGIVTNVLPSGYIITHINKELSILQTLNELDFPVMEGLGIRICKTNRETF
jgi:hypothetical protein